MASAGMFHRGVHCLEKCLNFSLVIARSTRSLPLQGTTALPSLRRGYTSTATWHEYSRLARLRKANPVISFDECLVSTGVQRLVRLSIEVYFEIALGNDIQALTAEISNQPRPLHFMGGFISIFPTLLCAPSGASLVRSSSTRKRRTLRRSSRQYRPSR